MIVLLLVLVSSFITLLSNDIFIISEVYFYVVIMIAAIDYLKRKSLSLLQVWLIAFIFIIISEALLTSRTDNYFLEALRYLIAANNVLILGYILPVNKKTVVDKRPDYILRKTNQLVPIIFIALIGLYVGHQLPKNLVAFLYGRSISFKTGLGSTNLIINSLFESIALVLPSIMAFYYKEIKRKKNITLPLLLSLPIFFVLFIGGTRFPLLFSFGGFIITIYSGTFKKGITLNPKVIIAILILVMASILMKTIRISGYESTDSVVMFNNSETRITKFLSSQMSPEGVIDMTALMIKHFESQPHTYGKSMSFLTYFWIPRSIWPEKPTMLGNWLIREYRSGFSDFHSSSFGFTGELYADYGYFSLVLIFFIGIIMRKLNNFSQLQFSHEGSYKKIIAAMLFPFIFFFVRSAITATLTLFGVLIIYYLMKRILFIKV